MSKVGQLDSLRTAFEMQRFSTQLRSTFRANTYARRRELFHNQKRSQLMHFIMQAGAATNRISPPLVLFRPIFIYLQMFRIGGST